MSGLLLPLFSLYNEGGAPGDLGKSATNFVDLLADAGLRRWLILPIGPTRVDRRLYIIRTLLYGHIGDLDQQTLNNICAPLRLNEHPPWFDKCPYLPTSAFAVNPFYIDSSKLDVDGPFLTASLHNEPVSSKSYCPWISGWLGKHEKLALAFQSKQHMLCTDRQFLSRMRALIFYESRCKAQRSAATRSQFQSLIEISEKEGAPDSPRVDLKLSSGPSPKEGEGNTPLNVEGVVTGDTTATAAQANAFSVDYQPPAPFPKRVESWPEWLRVFWDFISCDENRFWLLDYAAFESSLDKESLSGGTEADLGEAGFVEDWQKWACSGLDIEERVLNLWDNSEALFLCLEGNFCIAQEFQRSFLFHLYCQFIAVTQLKSLNGYALSKNVQICGDCPIYLPLQSCDCWTSPTVFGLHPATNRPTQVSGLPPDFWSAEGQLWNTPLYNWEEAGTAVEHWWSSRIMHALSLTTQMRIDHFRAFADFWAVDVEWADTRHNGLMGVWKKGPGAPLFTRFFKAHPEVDPKRVIVEDLCEPTPDFIEMQKAVPFARMEVLQFHLEHLAAHKDEQPTDSWLLGKAIGPLVIFSGTHDNPTLKEWMDVSASDAVKEFLGEHLGKVPMRSGMLPRFLIAWMIELIKKSCEGEEVTVYVPVQDILCLGVEGRLNRPGAFEPTMWSWRLDGKQMSELKGLVKWMRSHLSLIVE